MINLTSPSIATTSWSISFDRSKMKSSKIVTVFEFTNSNSFKIGFKMKTTASHMFAVKPGNGFLEPGKSKKLLIALILDGSKIDKATEQKFNLQIIGVGTEDEGLDFDLFWNSYKKDRQRMKGHKLKVIVKGLTNVQNQISEEAELIAEREDPAGVGNSIYQSAMIDTIKEVREESDVFERHSQVENLEAKRPNYQEQLEEKDKTIFMLQEEKTKLEAEVGRLRSQIMSNRSPSNSSKVVQTGFQMWQVLLMLIMGLLVGQLIK